MGDHHADALQRALNKRHTIVLGGYSSVRYSGRAESFLDYGDLIIMIKSDHTLLIHQARGNAPVNYMKPGTTYNVTQRADHLHIHAEHPHLKEYMDISLRKIYFFHNHNIEQGGSIQLEGTEKDMSDMIYDHPELIGQEFKTLTREEQTPYGFVDVLGYDKDGALTVIECKRYVGDFKAVDQLRRYVEKIKVSKGITNVNGILACPKITPHALAMLHDFGFTHVKVNPPKRHDRFNKSQTRLQHF